MIKDILKRNAVSIIAILLTFGIVQALLTTGIISDYYLSAIVLICINIILGVSLNLVVGFTGQFSLGHAGFMAIGAYVCALVTMRMDSTAGFLIGIFAGAILAALVGVLIGLPTLRLRGDYLAIATLGTAEIIRILFLNMKVTNGAAGLNGIPQHTNWLWLFVFTILTIVCIKNFINSSHGRACISIREDEIAAESMGINTTKYKVMAFAIGAFFAGIAGGLYASYFYFLKPDIFGFMKSIDILVIVVLGGLGSLSGSIVAGTFLAVITTYLQSFAELRMIIYSLVLIVVMIFRPQGLMGNKELSLKLFKDIFDKENGWLARKRNAKIKS